MRGCVILSYGHCNLSIERCTTWCGVVWLSDSSGFVIMVTSIIIVTVVRQGASGVQG